MVRAGMLMYFLVCCWDPPFIVEAGMQYSWGAPNVKGIFQFPEQHLKSAPIHEVTWPGTEKDRPEASQSNLQALALPMFQHSPVPLASTQFFKPFAGKHSLPYSLVDLLLPHRYVPPSTPVQLPHEHNVPRVEVSCGSSMISVRVNRKYLEFKAQPSMFRLGTCPVMFATTEYLYFHYYLNDCGSKSTTVKGKLVYSNILEYSPEPQGEVLRAVPLSVPIHCQYNRFHYSYKVGYVPEVNDRIFMKSLKTRRTFNLTALNAQWEPLNKGESYALGEAMYFEASAQYLSKNQRVFVDSCHVTTSNDPSSIPRQDVVTNFGCLVDSKRTGSLSQFYFRDSNILRFSIDSFLFPNDATERLYLHCSVSVRDKDPTATAKSCTYNSTVDSWQELHGFHSMCSCCKTKCDHTTSILPTVKTFITSDLQVGQRDYKSISLLPKVVGNNDTWTTEEVGLRANNGTIQEMEEDTFLEEPIKVDQGPTELKEEGRVVKDRDHSKVEVITKDEMALNV